VTISIGLAERAVGETGHGLMDRADAALYFSKRNGRNMVSIAAGIPAAAAETKAA